MRKSWWWFVLSGVWIFTTVLNILDNRSSIVIGFNVFSVILFTLLGITQYLCDKKGEQGKRIFNWICAGASAILVLIFVLTFVGILK